MSYELHIECDECDHEIMSNKVYCDTCMDKLKTEIENLEEKLETADCDNEELSNKNDELERRIDDLVHKIADLELALQEAKK